MPRHDELIKRLATADPLRDGEQLTAEDQRVADALLTRLLATPVAPEVKPRRSRTRHRGLALAGAVCAAVAAFAAVDLLDSDSSGSGVIDRAVAAVSRHDAVYHIVEFTTAKATPPLDGRQPPPVIAESWYTSDGRLHRTAFVVRDGQRGRMAEDFAGRRLPGRTSGSALRWDGFTNTITESGFARGTGDLPYLDSFAGPATQLRALERDGRLKLDGTTSVDGRRAYRLVSKEIEVRGDYTSTIEFTVDAETYMPLTQHITNKVEGGRTLEAMIRYRTYEQLPLDAEADRLLALDPHPNAKCSKFAHELTGEKDLGFPNPCAR